MSDALERAVERAAERTRIAKAVRDERERCARIAAAYAQTCRGGSAMSSMAEDSWGAVVGDEIAKLIRRTDGQGADK